MVLDKLVVVFSAGMTVGEKINIYYNDGVESLSIQTAVLTRTGYGEVATDANSVVQAYNYNVAMTTDYGNAFTVVGHNNKIELYPKIGSMEMLFDTTSSSVTFEYEAPVFSYNTKEALVRSPELNITTGSGFSSVGYTFKQFEGDLNTYASKPISYSKTKKKLNNTQNNVWINISNLGKESLKADILGYRTPNTLTSKTLGAGESKWMYVKEQRYLYSASGISTDKFYFLMDGYVHSDEIQSIPNILTSSLKKKINRDSVERLHFKTKNLSSINYYNKATPGTQTTVAFSPFEVASLDNNKYVQSVKVNNTAVNVNETLVYKLTYLEDETLSFTTIEYSFYNECKYELYDLVFKNKNGVLETLSLSKKLTKNLKVDSKDYLRSIVDLNGNFNVANHTNKQYNITGQEEWTLNTDFIPEYMNETITQAMLSEEAWLVGTDGKLIPVVKSFDNVQYKTSLNDKLIQYTIKVKMSHNKVNNIQ
jgi:hypothetical protein